MSSMGIATLDVFICDANQDGKPDHGRQQVLRHRQVWG